MRASLSAPLTEGSANRSSTAVSAYGGGNAVDGRAAPAAAVAAVGKAAGPDARSCGAPQPEKPSAATTVTALSKDAPGRLS